MKFRDLLRVARKNEPDWQPPHKLLCLDPGETTGWALYIDGDLADHGQAPTKDNPYFGISELFIKMTPTHVVCEDYRVYGHKTDQHSWSALHTPRLIGGIEMLCFIDRIPIHFQMAATAKPFCTPQKLKEWGFWIEGMRHADDAIKHGAYFLLFHNRKGAEQ